MEQSIDLVYEQDAQIVTDSITLAEVFEKRHDKILRDIRNLKCPEDFHSLNFGESSYINKQGREMPLYIITENGFYLLAMGYTGEKAMEFKVNYINEFQRMRTDLESRTNQTDTLLMGETADLIESFESRITIISKQQKEIQKAVQKRIYSLYPTTPSKARMKYFSKIYQDIKKFYEVDSYRDILEVDYEGALLFIAEWGLAKIGES